MQIAICDDLFEHREKIKAFVSEFFKIRQIAYEIFEFENGQNICNSKNSFDIAFIDIELGDVDGFFVAKKLVKKNPNLIIIVVTSYNIYLDAAMDMHVLRFITKPISQEKIFSSLLRALNEMKEKIISLNLKDNSIIRLSCRNIIYIEANLKSVIVHTLEKDYIVKNSLKNIKEMITTDYFAVPHNSYIVNLNYITSFRREFIIIKTSNGNETIYISNRKQPEFKRRFLNFIGESY